MPELPEVETIARGLRKTLTGKRVESLNVLDSSVLRQDESTLRKLVVSRVVESVERRAKLLMLGLEGDVVFAFHLKMTGRVLAKPGDYAPGARDRIIARLSGAATLSFQDVRRFGYCLALPVEDLQRWPFYATLGPEPLSMGREAFAARFAGRKASIKSLLLNQCMIAGIGNIYADESLFAAGIHPEARPVDLSDERLGALYDSLTAVLRKAIQENGSSIRDYLNAEGEPGAFQNSFQAYGRKGQPCKRCGAPLQASRVAGRTSTYCPACQRRR
ncbi:MAG: bifunctional DNA-formamidopyrimidine glycosylase/DNA-(apurinic or apyrimidinic site) lyase [Desulfovibrionaceae bacterium]